MKYVLSLIFMCGAGFSHAQVNYPPDVHENGFIMLDVLKPLKYSSKSKEPKIIAPMMHAEDLKLVEQLGLQGAKPLYKFNSRPKSKDQDAPWLSKDFDITRSADAEMVAKLTQRYIFEGWFSGKDLSKNDTHFRSNEERNWCNTPWLNVSEKGREAIHGLTKEFPIRSTTIFKVPDDIEAKELAVTWGLSFFNQKICNQYGSFFKEQNMITQIKNKKPVFEAENGAVSFKLLFNAMPDWQKNMPQWDGAYNWMANVSHARQNDNPKDGDESLRQLMNIPLVQIDVGLRDSRLKGTNPLFKNWIMMSYYYDKDYTNELLADMQIPEALKHMRPFGLQYGLDAGQSIIFQGANNNHRPGYNGGDRTELPYSQTRLNGPVDNTVSSCLGCHAQSGLSVGLEKGESLKNRQGAPLRGMGFMTNDDYAVYAQRLKNGGFDFNMQLDKAMRNFALSKNKKINGEAPVK